MYLLEIWDCEDRYVSENVVKLQQKAEENYISDDEEISFTVLDGYPRSWIVKRDDGEIGTIKEVEVVV